MALEFNPGQMARNIEVSGLVIKHMERELSGMLMETAMKANSKEINLTAMAFIHALMVLFIKVCG